MHAGLPVSAASFRASGSVKRRPLTAAQPSDEKEYAVTVSSPVNTTSEFDPEKLGVETAGIERRSIDYVPYRERHGKASGQIPLWFMG